MKVLLDENLPHELRHFLAEHEAITVAWLGWQGMENGELLSTAADQGFDVLVSMDRGIEHEQDVSSLPLSVVLIRAESNTMDDLRPLVPELLGILSDLPPGALVKLGRNQ